MSYNFNFTTSGYTPSYNFNFGTFIRYYYILPGTSNDFKAIWADVDTSLTLGKFYIASADCFSIIKDTVLLDYYTISHKGRTGDKLNQPDIKDINV
jgi:hypothetical protein